MTSTLVYGIVSLIIMILLYKFFKLAFKIIAIISIVSTVLIAAAGFFVVKDIMDMKENLPNSNSLFLFQSKGELIVGLSAKFSGEGLPEAITAEKLKEYNGLYKQEKFDAILKDYYKLFIFNIDSFNTEGNIEIFKDQQFDKKMMVGLLKSGDILDAIAGELMKQQGLDSSQKQGFKEQITKSIGDSEKLKASIVFMLFIDEANHDPLFLFTKYKSGNLLILPKTATFKFISVIPASTLESAFSEAKSMVKEKVNEKIG